MAKGKMIAKNNKPNNKSGNAPVKNQPMKPKGQIVKANNVKDIKPTTVSKKPTETVKKPIVKNEEKDEKKKIDKKVIDIADDEDDEDDEDYSGDDMEFDDMDDSDADDIDDSDVDDIDLMGESDDDANIDDSDDDDVESVSFDGNSDQESIEIEEKPAKTKKESKEIAKKEEKKPAPIEVKLEQVKKTELKKEEAKKPIEKKEKPKKTAVQKEEVVIDESTEEGKLLVEINKRKNEMNDCVVFIKKVQPQVNRQSIVAFVKPLYVVHAYIPGGIKAKKHAPRGYGFIRAVNANEADKMIEKFNKEKIEGCQLIASKFVCKKVYNDAKKIDNHAILLQSSVNVDLLEDLKKKFPAPIKVWKYNNTQYTVTFPDVKQSKELFSKGSIDVKGNKIRCNYFYHSKDMAQPKKNVEEKQQVAVKSEIKEEVKPTQVEPVVVKAGVKRTRMDSDSDEDDSEEEEKVVLKKTKMNDGTEVATAVLAEKKETPKKETPKKGMIVKTPESKKMTPQSNNNSGKKTFNKSPNFNNSNKKGGNNKSFNKSPGNKKFGNNKK